MCPRPFTHPHVSLIFSVGSVVLWSWVCEGTSALRRLALCCVSKAPYSGFALACGFFRGVRRFRFDAGMSTHLSLMDFRPSALGDYII